MDYPCASIAELSARILLLYDRAVCGPHHTYGVEPVTDDPLRVIFRLHCMWNTEKKGTP